MKRCTCCKVEKNETEFSQHTEKRATKLRNGLPFTYYNTQCRMCVAKKSRDNRIKNKDNPEFKRKHADYAIKAYWRTREVKLAVNKKSRDKPENKERRKRYDQEHRDYILAQRRELNKKYVEEITPLYAKTRISFAMRKQGNIISHNDIPAELVEIKIKQLKSCRTVRELRS